LRLTSSPAQMPLGDEQEPMNPYEPPRTEPPLVETNVEPDHPVREHGGGDDA